MKKVLVLFGGISPEHNVSIVSGLYVSNNIDKSKYEVENCYIDKLGGWNKYNGKTDVQFEEELDGLEKIDNIIKFLSNFDVVFPVLHGTNGEDGRIQGLLEIAGVAYVGSKVLGSSLAMDKVYAKMIFEKAGIMQPDYIYAKKTDTGYIYVDKNLSEKKMSLEELIDLACNKFKFPIYVKPSNSGSSLGISEVKSKDEFKFALNLAGAFDYKILIEQGIDARELECAVYGNEDVVTSKVGEILSARKFYDFNSKYKNPESKTVINPEFNKGIEEKIQKLAIKAYKALDCKGLSRVDFFLDKDDNIYISEINTIPGFTNISMYPKLFEASGIDITELLTKIIEIA